MSHGPHDGHSHSHTHTHDHDHDAQPTSGADPALDLAVPDAELEPGQLRRRGFLRGAGLLGAGIATASVLPTTPALADEAVSGRRSRRAPRAGYSWLAGDHHIHTQSSNDAMYRVADQVKHASAYGLDWMVITDHGSVAHAKIGVDKVNPDIVAARALYERRDAGLPGPGVEHPVRRARHRLRAPRARTRSRCSRSSRTPSTAS